MTSLFNHKKAALSFEKLPFSAQKAVLWRLGVEGDHEVANDVYAVLHDSKHVFITDIKDSDWLTIIEKAKSCFQGKIFYYSEANTDIVIDTVVRNNIIFKSDFSDWEDYTQWYQSSKELPIVSDDTQTPLLAPMGDPESVLDFGWDYLHAYAKANRKTVPLVEY